jgi:hypothetical protein
VVAKCIVLLVYQYAIARAAAMQVPLSQYLPFALTSYTFLALQHLAAIAVGVLALRQLSIAPSVQG